MTKHGDAKKSKWTVLKTWLVSRVIRTTGKTLTYTRCLARCECGTEREVTHSQITGLRSLCCGCHRSTIRSGGKIASRTTYNIWREMIRRCNDRNRPHYKDYGGRGIYVCPKWSTQEVGYEIFLAEMGERPSKKHSIERKDNNLGYFKENCKWATNHEQHRNKRNNVMVTALGKTQCVADWAAESGLSHYVISKRLRLGWPHELAVSSPVGTKHLKTRLKPQGSF